MKRYETVIFCNRPHEYPCFFPLDLRKDLRRITSMHKRRWASFLVVVEFARRSMNMNIPKSWKWIPPTARLAANPRSMFFGWFLGQFFGAVRRLHGKAEALFFVSWKKPLWGHPLVEGNEWKTYTVFPTLKACNSLEIDSRWLILVGNPIPRLDG